MSPQAVPQDLHVHTIFSKGDGAVVPEMTVELVAGIGHARVLGISDHLEYIAEEFPAYERTVRSFGLRLGLEINGAEWAEEAEGLPVDYYMYHCRDRLADYRGAERLAASGRPVIIAHPHMLETDLSKVPPQCLIEINNRYAWRDHGYRELAHFADRFRFVIGSDAHQPHWLNQNAARYIAGRLGIAETLLFQEEAS
jgi:histidinol phosphatase-like PHP family hydrolase